MDEIRLARHICCTKFDKSLLFTYVNLVPNLVNWEQDEAATNPQTSGSTTSFRALHARGLSCVTPALIRLPSASSCASVLEIP